MINHKFATLAVLGAICSAWPVMGTVVLQNLLSRQ
jgi:hypothetical protein